MSKWKQVIIAAVSRKMWLQSGRQFNRISWSITFIQVDIYVMKQRVNASQCLWKCVKIGLESWSANCWTLRRYVLLIGVKSCKFSGLGLVPLTLYSIVGELQRGLGCYLSKSISFPPWKPIAWGRQKEFPPLLPIPSLELVRIKKIMQMVYTFTKINNLNLFLLIQTHKKGMLCV